MKLKTVRHILHSSKPRWERHRNLVDTDEYILYTYKMDGVEFSQRAFESVEAASPLPARRIYQFITEMYNS